MKKSILWLFSLCLLACGFLTSCEKQNATYEKLIIGTWKLHSYSYYNDEGVFEKFYPEYGGDTLFYTYNRDGSMIVSYGQIDEDASYQHWEIEEDKLYHIYEGSATPWLIESIDSKKMILKYLPEIEHDLTYEFLKQ